MRYLVAVAVVLVTAYLSLAFINLDFWWFILGTVKERAGLVGATFLTCVITFVFCVVSEL